MQDKIDVNGEEAHPLYKFLRAQQPISQPSSKPTGLPFGEAGAIEWNYTKFLVDRNGRTVKRYKVSHHEVPLSTFRQLYLMVANSSW